MDGRGLTAHERKVLAEIEVALSRDRRLAHRMRAVRAGLWARLAEGARRNRAGLTAVLAVVCGAVLAAAVRTAAPAFIAVCAVVWGLLLSLGCLSLVARLRHAPR